MAVNQSAHPIKLLVGGNDYSAAVVQIDSWQSSPLDDGGLIKTTATCSLFNVRGLPGSLDDRLNPVQWRIGEKIEIFTTDSSNAWRIHPAGTLRILSAQYDLDEGRLTLNCGCLLTLLSYRQPTDTTKAQIDPGVFTPRNTVVSKLLTEAGITNVSMPYVLGYPLNSGISLAGSYLEAVGKLLYSAGYCAWVNSSETFCVKPINLLTPATFTLKIGGDTGEELWYRRLNNTEGPREIIKVTGVSKIAQPPGFPSTTSATKNGDASLVDPTLSGLIVVSHQTIQDNFGGNVRTTETTTEAPIGTKLPFLNYASAGMKLGLIPSEIRREKKHYDTGKEGKLQYVGTEVYRPIGEALAEYYQDKIASGTQVFGLPGLMLAEVMHVDYSYDAKERPSLIKTQKYETTGALLAGTDQDWSIFASAPIGLRLSEVSEETWKEQRTNEWEHKTEAYKVLARVKPELAQEPDSTLPNASQLSINQKLSLVADDQASIREVSNSGQTNPPAPERKPADAGFEDEQIKGEAQFAQFGGNPLQERERTFQIEYLEGLVSGGPGTSALPSPPGTGPQAQCEKMAVLEGQMLFGRHKGQDLGMNLRDELFAWEPLMRVNCKEPNGTVRAYALDNAQWYLGNERAMVNFDAIWVGTVGGGTLPPPVTATVGGGTSVVVTVV